MTSAKKMSFKKSRDIPIYLMILPALLLIILFNYIPIYGVSMAFIDFSPYRGIFRSEWLGFKNFAYFLTDDNFWRVMRNTIIINFYQLLYGFPVPVIFAIMLNELSMRKYKKFIQTVSYLPHFISWVVAAGIVSAVLSPAGGLVNNVIKGLFSMEPIYFLAKEKYFRTIIVASNIWKGFGMSAVYYLAVLSSIDPEYYEAARIDGAGRMRQIWHITLPGIKTIAIVLLILQIGNMTTIGFEQIFLLYNPMVYNVGDVISTYTYRLGIEQLRYSLTTAIGFTQSIVNFIMVYSANVLSRKIAGWALW
ncbi:MAG: sugar ABC transporter permease [Clostridiaceae bacterium]|nr:sugar ABC transporter permease [Clostridiaceae bacterium]